MSATAIAEVLAEHQYSGQWARYNTSAAATICRCGAEYHPSRLYQHQAEMLTHIVAEQIATVVAGIEKFEGKVPGYFADLTSPSGEATS